MASLAPALAFLATEKPSNLHKAALAAALVDLAEALVQWHTVTSRLAEAHRLTAARARLEDTRDRMMSGTPGVEKAIANVQRIRAAWGTPTRGPSPLPNVLQPPAPTPKVQRGTERDYGR